MPSFTCIDLSSGATVPIPNQTVVCLGNFDGVHLAHRALLERAKILRQNHFPDAALCVFSFFEPSWVTLSKAPAPQLSTLEEKLETYRAVGMEYAILCEFAEIKSMKPADFVFSILQNTCHTVAAVCGFNYRFGQKGSGTPALLQELLQAPVSVQEEISVENEAVSSTRIRSLLTAGNVEAATALLTVPYAFSAEVVHGKALGATMGFPTLNQFPAPHKLLPRNGVYLTACEIDGVHYYGVSNVGVRPTVDCNDTRNCETHLLDASGDFYGKIAKISFLRFLRPEQKFESIDALQAQIKQDIASARRALTQA